MTTSRSNRMNRVLVVVRAPHYCASLVIGRRSFSSGVVCLEAAPILRWALGRSWLELEPYFERKGIVARLYGPEAREALLRRWGTSGAEIRRMNRF